MSSVWCEIASASDKSTSSKGCVLTAEKAFWAGQVLISTWFTLFNKHMVLFIINSAVVENVEALLTKRL